MKYSIRGGINVTDESILISVLNRYTLWRLIINVVDDVVVFEAWINLESDKDHLFDDLKVVVDNYGGHINWHKCNHDESVTQPCLIVEEYEGG